FRRQLCPIRLGAILRPNLRLCRGDAVFCGDRRGGRGGNPRLGQRSLERDELYRRGTGLTGVRRRQFAALWLAGDLCGGRTALVSGCLSAPPLAGDTAFRGAGGYPQGPIEIRRYD